MLSFGTTNNSLLRGFPLDRSSLMIQRRVLKQSLSSVLWLLDTYPNDPPAVFQRSDEFAVPFGLRRVYGQVKLAANTGSSAVY